MAPWGLLLLGLGWAAPDDGACPACRVDDADGWRLDGAQIVGPGGEILRFEGELDASGELLKASDVNVERGRLAAELEARGLKLGEAGGRIVTTALGEPTVVIEGEVLKGKRYDKNHPGEIPPKAIARITRRCGGVVRVSAEGESVDTAQLTRAASQVLWADPACERYNARAYRRISETASVPTPVLPMAPIPPDPEGSAKWPWVVLGLGLVAGGAGLWVRQRNRSDAASAGPRSAAQPAQPAPFRPREIAGPAPEIQSIGWGAGPVYRPGDAASPPVAPPVAPTAPPPVSPPVAAPVVAAPPVAPPPAPSSGDVAVDSPDPPGLLELKPIPFAAPPRVSGFGLAPAAPASPEPPMLPENLGPVFSPKPIGGAEAAPADPLAAAVAALGQQMGLDRSYPSAGQAMRVPATYAAFLETCDGISWGGGWLRLLGVREGRGLTVHSLNAGLAGRIGRRFAFGYFGDGGLVALSPRGEVVVGFPDGRPSRNLGSNLTSFLASLGRDAELRESLCDSASMKRVARLVGPLGPDQVFDWGSDPPKKTFILARWEGASML